MTKVDRRKFLSDLAVISSALALALTPTALVKASPRVITEDEMVHYIGTKGKNIRQLCLRIQHIIHYTLKQHFWEPMDSITFRSMKQMVDLELEQLRVQRDIYEYMVMCDETNNPPDSLGRIDTWIKVPYRAEIFRVSGWYEHGVTMDMEEVR